jgi:cobalamin-dependent methionine synthase I
MTAETKGIQKFDPFVYRMDPAYYPVVAGWYAEQESIFDSMEKALRAVDSLEKESLILDPCRGQLEDYLDRTRPDWRARRAKDIPEALAELHHFTRFFKEVKAQVGCAGQPMNQRIRDDLLSLLKEYSGLIQPAALLGTYPCTFEKDGVIIGAQEPIRSKSLLRFYTTRLKSLEEEEYASYETDPNLLSPPDQCYLFAATIGPGIDEEVSRLSQGGENYKALLLNGIGAGAADMTAVDLELFVNRDLALEGDRWRRFHVGYGDFKLEEQKRLFALLDPAHIGIRLNPACIMIPEKSVSGIMALKHRLSTKEDK